MDKYNSGRYKNKSNVYYDDFSTQPHCSDPCFNQECNQECNQICCGEFSEEDCYKSILRNQAEVSRCEAEMFCSVSKRFCCEMYRPHNLSECYMIINMISNFLLASASKEKAIAEVINSCKSKDKHSCSCENICK
ncbi:MAG: hypothetical protein ACERKV_12045 [Clostridiaceae bacterium]